jgi:hypothetical protein
MCNILGWLRSKLSFDNHKALTNKRHDAAKRMVVAAATQDGNSFAAAWNDFYGASPATANLHWPTNKKAAASWESILFSTNEVRQTLMRWWFSTSRDKDAMLQLSLAACRIEGLSDQRERWIAECAVANISPRSPTYRDLLLTLGTLVAKASGGGKGSGACRQKLDELRAFLDKEPTTPAPQDDDES